MARITLITGGARSGKSSYALTRGEALPGKRLFIATCPAVDREMGERVRRHREERRGRGWETVEEECDLDKVLAGPGRDFSVLLVDCLTLWVNNLLHAHQTVGGEEFTDRHLVEHCRLCLQAVEDQPGTLILVTNEVGLGIVPDNPLARQYRDLVGTA
ncbi:MAG: bifunctional adenosylcobinamide kinase/adenosylcobinamide-phosphate guanylyltransferase, partial [Desulforhopalus sp.]|nr:bifunctional adenosylcobinamide kinase/adenosylcobinamide-phosphate guanylyltransferase [Desulforhopalus sp.]